MFRPNAAGARQNLGLYKSSYYKEKVVAFEHELKYRSIKAVKSFKLYEDAGRVMNPKFFRRQVEHEQHNFTAADPKTFEEALRTGTHAALLFDAYSKLPPAERRDPKKLKA